MAVTTSNGDGFALYNGVKLPNIDAYGGAFLWKVDLSSLTPDAVAYQLTGSKGDFVYTNSQSLADENGIPSATETWTEFVNLVGVYPNLATSLWTSMESSELYSVPVPLDGMTVIEWNGDTSGLPVDNSGIYYTVGTYINAYDAFAVVDVYGSFIVSDDFNTFTDTNDNITGWTVGADVFGNGSSYPVVMGVISTDSLQFASADTTEGNLHTSLIVYTSSGDDDGDTSPKEKHYCRVDGTVYEVEGGTARMGGTFCEVKSGTVLIDGTVYDFALN